MFSWAYTLINNKSRSSTYLSCAEVYHGHKKTTNDEPTTKNHMARKIARKGERQRHIERENDEMENEDDEPKCRYLISKVSLAYASIVSRL